MDVFWDSIPTETGEHTFDAISTNSAKVDWKSLRPHFRWQSEQVIQNTYKVTSRYGDSFPQHDCLKKISSPINDGSTMAQFFVGKGTLLCDAYGIKIQKQFINTLCDSIKTRGAMDTIITDGGKYEISKKIGDLLRSLFIEQYESEPYHQHQNKAEQCYGVVKWYINTLMNLTGASAHCWLLCLVYVCALLNDTESSALMAKLPLKVLLDKLLISVISYLSHFGSLFNTR